MNFSTRKVVNPSNATKIRTTKKLDLDKLARSVSIAETAWCTKWSAITHKNCFGIMDYSTWKRRFKKYTTKQDSFKDFKRIWSNYYWGYPDYKKAKRYTGNDKPKIWLAIVDKHYKLIK